MTISLIDSQTPPSIGFHCLFDQRHLLFERPYDTCKCIDFKDYILWW
jgi:hypothetical protein